MYDEEFSRKRKRAPIAPDECGRCYPLVPWHFGSGPLLAPSLLPKSDLPHWPFIRIHLSLPIPGIMIYAARPDWPEVIRIGISAFVATMLVYFINQGAAGIRVTRPFPRPLPA